MRWLILVAMLFGSSLLHATTWFATASTTNIDTVGLWVPTQGASCAGSGTALVWGNQLTGDTFNANGCTALAIDVDPGSVSKQVTLTTDTTNGGGFTLTMAACNTIGTVHAHITATKTTALVVSGTTSACTISGNITGGNATGTQVGISDTHTTGTLTIVGNITGGSAANAHGFNTGVAGPVVITGNVTSGTVAGVNGLNSTSSAPITLTGNCVGSDTVSATACSPSSSGVMTVTGNLINGKRGSAITGSVIFTPAAGNYILYPKNSSYVVSTIDANATETPTNPGTANVRSGTVYGSFTGGLVAGSTCVATQGWR